MPQDPLLPPDRALVPRGSVALAEPPARAVRRWGQGESTLQELKNYSEEELFHIAQQGYALFLNGKIREAQVIFEGLVAVDPRNDYYYRALGVVYHQQGDAERALRQFQHAITVAPNRPNAYINRAEVHIARRDFAPAIQDLNKAVSLGEPTDPLTQKAIALRSLLQSALRAEQIGRAH